MWLMAVLMGDTAPDPALNMLSCEILNMFPVLSGKMRDAIRESGRRLSGIETQVWGELHLE